MDTNETKAVKLLQEIVDRLKTIVEAQQKEIEILKAEVEKLLLKRK
jgi:hypothetical protein